MEVGSTKTVEWLRHQEPIKPHQKLAQKPQVLHHHHNRYSVLVEHTKEDNMKMIPVRDHEDPPPKTGHDVFKPVLKETNPKDAVGVRKVPFSTVPSVVIAEVGLALLEGARKYGRHNYRVAGIRTSVYYDAAERHLKKWWEGQDIDTDSGIHHISKAIATLVVLRDAMLNDKAEDDRPPAIDGDVWRELDALAGEIIDRYPDAKAPYTQVSLVGDP